MRKLEVGRKGSYEENGSYDTGGATVVAGVKLGGEPATPRAWREALLMG